MNNSLKMDPLQTWLAALLTLLCIAVAIGSAKAASTVSPQPPEPSSTSASVTVEGKDRMLCADQDGRIMACDAFTPPCEEQMEAAMRAMEPFSAANAPIWNETDDVYRSGIRIEMHGRKFEAEMRRAIRIWERVKRECWRQP